MNGILNVYKESGYSSHDVVAVLRKILKTKKIGHTGTLDPNAEGVLPVCIGQATKVSELLMEKDKTYQVEFELGFVTDTQDIWGNVIHESSVSATPEEVKAVANRFVGDILQIPPMYSAIKQNGKKLYELAREGIVLERKARPVRIDSIEDFSCSGKNRYTMTVQCSKGTYIRTLCHDIGAALGCGARMTALIRTKAGEFTLQTAKKLEEIKALQEKNELCQEIISVEKAFRLPKLYVKESFSKWLYAGNPIAQENIEFIAEGEEQKLFQGKILYFVYDFRQDFIGIYYKEQNQYKVLKFLYQVSEDKNGH